MELKKKILFHGLFQIKQIVIKKNRPNIKEKKIEGLRWKFEGLSMKIKEKREKKKKKIVDTKLKIH